MKKIILFLAVFISFTQIVSAKTLGLALGVKGGAEFASASVSNIKVDNAVNFHGGFFSKLSLPIIGVQAELLFQQRNIKSTNYNDNLYFVSVPILANYNLPIIGEIISLQGGASFGFLLNSASFKNIIDQERYQKAETSVIFGVNVKIKKINIYARYIYNVTDIYRVMGQDINPNGIQAGLGWSFFDFGL